MDPVKCQHCGQMRRLAYIAGADVNPLLHDVRFTVTLTRTPRVYVWETSKRVFKLFDEKKYLKKALAFAKAADELECPVCGRKMDMRAAVAAQ